jgi:hypothetical protein
LSSNAGTGVFQLVHGRAIIVMSDPQIIDWPAWTDSPPGRYVLGWEQAQLDRIVSDVFGFHALQLGLPQLDALRENRMPYRGLVLDPASGASAPYRYPWARGIRPRACAGRAQHHVVRPARPAVRVAERRPDRDAAHARVHVRPARLLREAERVLMPEGRRW